MGGRIGEGAGAIICRAIERSTRREVAIKHVRNEDGEQDKFVVQAENEYEIAHQLDHPHLRAYYDIKHVRKWLKTKEVFLIMEFVDGERLEDKVPPELDDRILVFVAVAEGLHAMHTAGFAHADIKPNNIMLLANGDVKIIDFGQSCPLGHRKERIQGTPDYIAPEQINRHPIDHRTDIYNLGATMYQVFTGKHFETMMSGAEPGVRKQEVEARRDRQPPHELDSDIPLALSKLIMECCETAPDDRPRDMRAVISRLGTALHTLERKRSDSPTENGAQPAATAASQKMPAPLEIEHDPLDIDVDELLSEIEREKER